MCVPALQGLGTPSWDAGARGALFGFTRATTRAQVVRAVIDGVLHQIADALTAIRATTAVDSLLVDGGLSRSDWVLARLAEVARVRVVRAARSDATAIGAAMMAGLGAGVWGGADAAAGARRSTLWPSRPGPRPSTRPRASAGLGRWRSARAGRAEPAARAQAPLRSLRARSGSRP